MATLTETMILIFSSANKGISGSVHLVEGQDTRRDFSQCVINGLLRLTPLQEENSKLFLR